MTFAAVNRGVGRGRRSGIGGGCRGRVGGGWGVGGSRSIAGCGGVGVDGRS